MLTATGAHSKYADHVLEVMRRLPIEKQAQVSGYADALEETLGDELSSVEHDIALIALDEMYAQALTSGELEDMGAGLAKRGF